MQPITACISEWENQHDHKGQFVSYKMKISSGSTNWEINHRFKAFDELNGNLKLNFGNLPPMPRKTLFALSKREDIDKRMADLDYFVRNLISRTDMLANSHFNEFFEIEKHLPKAGVRQMNMIGQVVNNAMGYRDFIYLPQKRLLFTAISDMNALSRVDSYFTNMDLPWEKNKNPNQVLLSVGVIEA